MTLSNAIGTGVADDKSIYPYVPKMIEFYLGERADPATTCRPTSAATRTTSRYVLDHLGELVVKEVHGAGGYGMLVGPAATAAEIEDFRGALKADPSRYIAQPTLALSTCPTFVESGIAPRHIDLRPFVLSGKTVQMVPGGLTRVALKEGSLVVNSSQGGGTKDTWILEADGTHAVAHRRSPVLDGPLHGAGREHRAHARRQLPDVAAAAIGRRGRARLARPAQHQRAQRRLRQALRRGDAASVMDYMVSDEKNGSSIRCCLMAARENARAVRGTLTTEVWETQNQTWLEFQRMVATDAFQREPERRLRVGQVPLAPVARRHRRHDAAGRGLPLPAHRQLPRARRQHGAPARRQVPLGRQRLHRPRHRRRRRALRYGIGPSQSQSQSQSGGGSQSQSQSQSGARQPDRRARARSQASGKDVEFDFYHWSAVLRSVSGFEVYRKVYRNVIRPEKVAELLILRPDMPRSLAACMHEVAAQPAARRQRAVEATRCACAGRLDADLQYGRIDEILATGLHAYLTQFLERVNALGAGISRDFLVPVAP